MPLYAYTCRKCEHTFQALVFPGDDVECPECKAQDLQRLLSIPAAPPSEKASVPMACNSSGPPCGAPWCQRKA